MTIILGYRSGVAHYRLWRDPTTGWQGGISGVWLHPYQWREQLLLIKLKQIYDGMVKSFCNSNLISLPSSRSLWRKTRFCFKTGAGEGSHDCRGGECRFTGCQICCRQVKQSVVGTGAADKEQVQHGETVAEITGLQCKPMRPML